MATVKMTSKVDIIINEILNGDFSTQDLWRINDAARKAHRNKSIIASQNFEVGETVEFTCKSGKVLSGKVVKVNTKNILVKTSPVMSYKVPAAMLRVVV